MTIRLDPRNCSHAQPFSHCFQNITNRIHLVYIIVIPIILVVSVFGNGLVLASLFIFPKLRRSPTNVVLFSLTVSGIATGLILCPLLLYYHSNCGCWYMSRAGCDLYHSLDNCLSTVVILHLVVISVERYVAILHPLWHYHLFTRTHLIVTVVVIWICAAIYTFLPTCTHWAYIEDNFKKDSFYCGFDVNVTYAVVTAIFTFYLPCLLFLVAYTRVLIELRRPSKLKQSIFFHQSTGLEDTFLFNSENDTSNKTIYETNEISDEQTKDTTSQVMPKVPRKTNTSKPSNVSNSKCYLTIGATSLNSLREEWDRKEEHHKKAERRSTILVLLIVVCFLISWLPMFVLYTLIYAAKMDIPIMMELVFLLVYANSAINPLIYTFNHSRFRKAFKRILFCCKCFSIAERMNGTHKLHR